MVRGFILHPTYYLERGRPVVHLFGVAEDGATFVIRDDRTRPFFFIRTRDVAATLRVLSFAHEATDWTDSEGEALSAIRLNAPPDAPRVRDPLQAAGFPTYEADIPFATRFLIDHELRGSVEIEGNARTGRLVDRIYVDPALRPCDWTPALRVLSLDIETDPDIQRLLSVALVGCGASEVLIFDPDGRRGEAGSGFATEADLLLATQKRIRALDPDVITGWNVIDFDLVVLEGFFRRAGVPFAIGRADLPVRIRLDSSGWGTSRAIVPGRVVLDGLGLLRDAFVRLEDYRLETAAQEILGHGKLLAASGRAEDILEWWRSDPKALAEYNRRDAELVLEILEARHLVELAVRRSQLTGMPLDRVAASIASFDFLYLVELHREKIAAPTTDPDRPQSPTAGGWVFDSTPGIFENVAVFDFKSLYPSLIRTFRLDPLRERDGILPRLLDRLFPLREEALAQGDRLRAQALKIQMNSFYGVLATPRCRFYSPETANRITGLGQTVLRWTRAAFERRGYTVLYGDTDSLFVDLDLRGDAPEAGSRAAALAEEMNREIAAWLAAEHDVQSRLVLQFEKLFRKLIFPALRGSNQGSKKRYVGLIEADGGRQLDFVGLESVRRDWTELAKRFQNELVTRVFDEEPVDGFVRAFVQEVRAGAHDELLVYRKALRKNSQEYTRTVPPHVQAARKMSRPPDRIVHYVMTDRGPEPADERTGRFDYEHYVQKQVRPVAESILSLLGKHWDSVAGDQGTLF